MIGELSRGRRFAVAFFSLLCAAIVFRSQIAQALVIRGDDYLYRGDRQAAMERYRRALSIAPDDEMAADRYVFATMQLRTPGAFGRAVFIASNYLREHPHAAFVYADRALCYLHMRRYRRAERDYARAGSLARSARDYVFAGWAAKRAGAPMRAAAYWSRALRISPGFAAARFALSGGRAR